MSRNGLKIIIVGGGKVGKTLTAQLCAEGHDIAIIDNNADVVQELTGLYDVMGVIGNGATFSVLKDAGIEEADLFIAVTGSDELNLLCCTVAKQSSTLAAIARVRNPDYLENISFLKEKMGLELIINPEFEAAVEASRLLSLPTALEINTFVHGEAEIIKIKLPEDNFLNGKTVAFLGKTVTNEILICGVERDSEVFIPDGSFTLMGGDIISFIATKKIAQSFLKQIGFPTKQVRNTMIIGGGRSAYYLADQLIKSGIDVKIIENDSKRCETLSIMLPKATIINGDATNQDLLLEAGIESAQSFVPLTGIDEENIMLTLFAKQVSKAKVITKINRITFNKVINSLDLGSVIYPRNITSEIIIKYVRAKQASSVSNNVETLYHMFDSRAEGIEFKVKQDSPITDTPLKDLHLKSNTLIAMINRNGKIIIPNGSDIISVGDSVIVVTKTLGCTEIEDILK